MKSTATILGIAALALQIQACSHRSHDPEPVTQNKTEQKPEEKAAGTTPAATTDVKAGAPAGAVVSEEDKKKAAEAEALAAERRKQLREAYEVFRDRAAKSGLTFDNFMSKMRSSKQPEHVAPTTAPSEQASQPVAPEVAKPDQAALDNLAKDLSAMPGDQIAQNLTKLWTVNQMKIAIQELDHQKWNKTEKIGALDDALLQAKSVSDYLKEQMISSEDEDISDLQERLAYNESQQDALQKAIDWTLKSYQDS